METALQQIWKDTNQGKGIGVKKLKQLLEKAGIKLTQEEFESQEKAIVQSWEKLKRQKTGVLENNKAETNGDVSVLKLRGTRRATLSLVMVNPLITKNLLDSVKSKSLSPNNLYKDQHNWKAC